VTATAAGQSGEEETSPYRFLLEATLFCSYAVFGLSWIGYAPFLPDFRARFALTYAESSLLVSVVSFSKIVMPFLTGMLAARLGIRRSISLALVLICASVATPFAGTYPEVLASRLLFGLGGAMLVTLIGSAVMQWFPRRELPIVNGFNYVAVNTGISASLFVTLPLAAWVGQRNALLAYAAISCVLAIVWLLTGRERSAGSCSAGNVATESYGEVLRSPYTWFLALGFAGPLAMYLALNTWLPTFYAQQLGMTKAESSRLTGLFNLAGIPAAILGGVITKMWRRRKPLIWAPAALMSASAFGLFLLRGRMELHACAIVFGASLFLWISPLTTLAMELPGMTPRRFAMVMGVFYSVSYIGAFLAPVVIGALRDRTGTFVPGFALCAGLSLSLVVFGSMLPETGRVSAASR
jgi:CP family cyanate transporter-like MFS transporter